MLAVSDSGTRMDPEAKSHISSRSSPKGNSGSSLGLATVYGIVKQSGGFVCVYSELGQGTMFKVYLPKFGQGLPQRDTVCRWCQK